MRNAYVVFKRELGAYFNSPMAYVVAIAFMLLCANLFVLGLWAEDQVVMRGFFDLVSIGACIVIPAITMRTWAEERRSATYELLLTLPMRNIDLVLGKFFGALAFFLFCLSGSLVIPVVLVTLANPGLGPDFGQIFAAYLGTILAGMMLIAIGLFISSLCRDQIVAFIVSLLVIAGLGVVGWPWVANHLDSVISGLGRFLRDSVAFTVPQGRFERGLVDFGDVLYFLVWTAVFLFLNGISLESRLRSTTRWRHAAGVALGCLLAVVLGSVVLSFGPRLDFTADKLYTVSDAAGEILRTIPEKKPVRVKLYLSPKDEMPATWANLERDVVEKLEEFQRAADGRLRVDVVHLHADEAILRAVQQLRGAEAEEDDEEGAVEEQLLQEGVVPFRVMTGGLTGGESKVVYASMTMTYGASRKEIIPRLAPESLFALEQDLVTRVYRLVNDRKPVVGLLAPIQALDIPPQQMQLLAQLGMPLDQMPQEQDDYRLISALLQQNDQYEVRRLHPSRTTSLPDGLDTLIVIRPEQLSERLQWEVLRFLHGGGSVLLAAQSYEPQLFPTRRGLELSFAPVETGLTGLLEPCGLSIPKKMVMSPDATPLQYSFGFAQAYTVEFPWSFTLDAAHFDRDTSLANGLGGQVLIEAASPIEHDDSKLAELGLTARPIISTAADSWTRDVPELDVPGDIQDVKAGEGVLSLASLVQGQFPAPGGERPALQTQPAGGPPPDDPPLPEITAEPGKLVLIGTARPFVDTLIADRSGRVGWAGVLLKNSVDALSLGDELLRLTTRQPLSRPIRDLKRGTIVFYQVIIVGLAPAIYLVIGILRYTVRRRRQEQSFVPGAQSVAGGEA